MAVNVALVHGAHLGVLHAGPDVVAHVLNGFGRQIVGDSDALHFLVGLDHPQPREHGCAIHDFVDGILEVVEVSLPVDGGLAGHPLRALDRVRGLDSDAAGEPAFLEDTDRLFQGPQKSRPGIINVEAFEKHDVVGPGVTPHIELLRFDREDYGIGFPREDGDLPRLHRPVVGEVVDVVGGPHNQGVEVGLLHGVADPLQSNLINRPCHRLSSTRVAACYRRSPGPPGR